MTEHTDFELLELATPYALNAVSDDERADIDRRVAAAPSPVAAAVLVLHEEATERIVDIAAAQAGSLMLVVGPEGGIAPDELAALTDAGAVAVRLGPTVLRTSTAAAVALGAVGVLTSRWDASASDCEYCDVTRR